MRKLFEGRWRIESSEQFDLDDLDLISQASISFVQDGGEFQILAIRGELDCRYGQRDGLPCVEWTWSGDDDGSDSSGRGMAVIALDGSVNGWMFLHHGDEFSFRAGRSSKRRASR